jgi:DNA-binding transcriptional regulator YiaG
MPNINAVVNDQIRRLARREIRAHTKTIKKMAAHYRRDIAALKRQVSQLVKQVGVLQKQVPNQPDMPPEEVIQKARLRIDGLKGHRTRLGLSAKDYGKLLGVSGLTVYNWESGKSRPRRSQLPRIVAVRGIGKREALQRLGVITKTPNQQNHSAPMKPKSNSGRRGKFKQTGEQTILALLKGGRSLTTKAINQAWTKQGRAGSANVLLGKLVQDRKITRTKVKGERGSTYSAL